MRLVDSRKMFLAVFLVGIIAGVLYVNLMASELLLLTGVFQANYLSEYMMMDGSGGSFILYLIKMRIFPILILLLFVRTKMRQAIVHVFCVWTGFLWGIYMSMGVTAFGLIGVAFCLAGLFPHMLLYIPAYMIVLVYIYNYPQSMWNLYKLIVLFIFLGLGIFLESMVNPILLKWIIPLM